MSLKDDYFSVDCTSTDNSYERINFCGARAVSQQLTNIGIVNKLTLLADVDTKFNSHLVPGNFSSHSHGSVFYDEYYKARDVDSTVSFIYNTFYINNCH